MKYDIRYKPAFAAVFVTLQPGESLMSEPGAMASMDGALTVTTQLAGDLVFALLRKFLGGESLFINRFSNSDRSPHEVVLTQPNIGDIAVIPLEDSSICVQPGAYIAHIGDVKIGVQWAGFSSWLAREGLFKLKLSGKGRVFLGTYGGFTKTHIDGSFIVDSGHLVAYDPSISMNIQLAGGLIGSVTSGEGLVNRLTGSGDIYLQSRSIDGLVRFLKTQI